MNEGMTSVHIGPLPGRPRPAEHFLDIHNCNLLAKCLTINAVSITQQVLWCRFERESFQDLSRRPFGRRMRRYVEMHQASTIVLNHDEDEQNLEECCRNREKVNGDQLFRVIVQECSPGLRWRFRMADHIFRNRGFGNFDAKFEEFAVDSWRSPTRIVSAQSPNQFANVFRNRRPTRLSMSNLPGPVPTEATAVPTDNGGRFHDPERRTPSGPDARESNPETSISGLKSRSGRLSLQHDDLVS